MKKDAPYESCPTNFSRLIVAIESGDDEYALELLDNGVVAPNEFDGAPLTAAIRAACLPVVRRLLLDVSEDDRPELGQDSKRNHLLVASRTGNVQLVRFLCSQKIHGGRALLLDRDAHQMAIESSSLNKGAMLRHVLERSSLLAGMGDAAKRDFILTLFDHASRHPVSPRSLRVLHGFAKDLDLEGAALDWLVDEKRFSAIDVMVPKLSSKFSVRDLLGKDFVGLALSGVHPNVASEYARGLRKRVDSAVPGEGQEGSRAALGSGVVTGVSRLRGARSPR